MTYELKYTMSFKDKHNTSPADWRVDILADLDAPPDNVVSLIPAKGPLKLEYMNSDETKTSWIIGRKATISYVFTGAEGEPGVDVFFDTNERYHRVEVYKNEVLDGVYYIKPDAGQYDYAHDPYVITLTAVDGLAYAKSVLFDMYDGGQIVYEKIQLIDVILKRGLYQILDPDTKLFFVNTLNPVGTVSGYGTLRVVSAHTDMFFDFTSGPWYVFDVLESICKSLYARLFISQNAVWIVRIPDIAEALAHTEQYLHSVYLNTNNLDLNTQIDADAVPAIDNTPLIRMVPAVKTANFSVEYKSINQLINFDWADYDGSPGGTGFADWHLTYDGTAPVISRNGSGTVDDPYRALLPYKTYSSNGNWLSQFTINTGQRHYGAGDIVQFDLKYYFTNVKSFGIAIQAVGNSKVYHLNSGGDWAETIGTVMDYPFPVTRSGRKRDGTLSIKSLPMPSALGTDITLEVYLMLPSEKSYHTPAQDGDIIDVPVPPGIEGVEIYPIKLGVIGISATGRDMRARNTANYSYQQPDTSYNFIDTGQVGLSNTLFFDPGADQGDATPIVAGWESSKTGITVKDIERHMVQANVDEYAKSLRTFEGTIYANSLEFFNTFTIAGLSGKKFIQMRDRYDVESCKHDLLAEEILPEQTATIVINETDKYD